MIKSQVDVFRQVAIQKGSDNITLIDVLSAHQQLLANPDFTSELGVIWDLQGCRIDISLAEIMQLDPTLIERANAARPDGKTAWITATAMGEAIIQLLYQQFPWATQWKTFSTTEAAIAWIKGA